MLIVLEKNQFVCKQATLVITQVDVNECAQYIWFVKIIMALRCWLMILFDVHDIVRISYMKYHES